MSILEDEIEIRNPEQPHLATVLLLDTSGSMDGAKILALSEGLSEFQKEVSSDDLASKRVDLAVVTFGSSVSTIHNFSSVDDFKPPQLKANGFTPLGEAILLALDMVEQRKQQYKVQGINYYRPWIFMVTDGEPTDMQPGVNSRWNEVVKRVREGEANKEFFFFAVAVEPANTELLSQITPPNRPAIKLKGTNFRELFQWLSKNQSKVARSKVGEQVALESPTAAGWGEIQKGTSATAPRVRMKDYELLAWLSVLLLCILGLLNAPTSDINFGRIVPGFEGPGGVAIYENPMNTLLGWLKRITSGALLIAIVLAAYCFFARKK